MNFLQRQRNIEHLKNQISPVSRNKEGFLNVIPTNSKEHELRKFEVFFELKRRNCLVWSEVIFKNNKKSDIVAIDKESGEGYILEIVHSEKEDSINNKIDSYSLDFELFFLQTDKPLEIPI